MSDAVNRQGSTANPTLFGHPAGLYTLFFAEMWERFSFYGMRALLVFYMTKGFLNYGDKDGYAIYGAYTSLVYMTPFIGGMLADRILGARRAVLLGAVLMAAGEFLLTIPTTMAFFMGLGLLISGNGFFKPNISTIVGSLYPQGSSKRDGGFTIFYMGVNLGAAMSPLLCGYIGEKYGYGWGFGLATAGMLTGLAVFWNWLPPIGAGAPRDPERLRKRPVFITQAVIAVGATVAAVLLFVYHPSNPFSTAANVLVGVSLLAAAGVACYALRRDAGGLINVEWAIYLGAALLAPLFMLLVSGFAPLRPDNKPMSVIPESVFKQMNPSGLLAPQVAQIRSAVKANSMAAVDKFAEGFHKLDKAEAEGQESEGDLQYLTGEQQNSLREAIARAKTKHWKEAEEKLDELERSSPADPFRKVAAVVLEEISRPAGLIVLIGGLIAFGYLGLETVRLHRVARHRMYVVLVLTFFSMIFWAFYEQAGSSVNNFTDRNVDRVFPHRRVTQEDVGKTINLQPTQAQFGYYNGDQLFTLSALTELREEHKKKLQEGETEDPEPTIEWKVTEDDVGMGIADQINEIPASTFQSVNPIYILVLGLAFTALWTWLAARGLEPSTPVKFAAGLLQLAMGFAVFWYGAQCADQRGMVALQWLFLGYLLHTTGELCISPVGLSMVTNLSPARLVATVMGGWFLATSFAQLLAAIIAQFTSVTQGGGEGKVFIPAPKETVHVYGDTYGMIALCALGAAVICFALAPMLSRWMHPEVKGNGDEE